MRLALILAIAGLVAAVGPAAAQDAGAGAPTFEPGDLLDAPEVSAAASPSEVELGNRFTLVVTAAYDAGVTVNLPSRLDLGPAFEERKRVTVEKVRSDGKKLREWQIEVLAWELGEIQIPPVQVTFVRGGAADAVLTNAVPMRVVGVLGDMVDTAEPRGHAAPLPLWRRTWLWVLIAGGILLALILAFAIYKLRRPRRSNAVAAPVLRVSGIFRRRLGGPAEDALARLEAIDTSGMLARDRKVAYTEMVDVMQQFLGRQVGGDLEDMTTGELREWLVGAGIAAVSKVELVRWLDDCDLVKFGGLDASVDDGRAQIAAARDLVISIAMPAGSSMSAMPRTVDEPGQEAPRA